MNYVKAAVSAVQSYIDKENKYEWSVASTGVSKSAIVGLRAQVWPAQQVKCPYVYMSDRTAETAAAT